MSGGSTSVALAERFFAALNEWDFEAMGDLCDADVEIVLPYVPPGFPTDISGARAWIEHLRNWQTQLDGSENLGDFEISAFASDPEKVVAVYSSNMVLRAGPRHANHYVALFTIRDDKVCEFREYFDPILLLQAFGGEVPEFQI